MWQFKKVFGSIVPFVLRCKVDDASYWICTENVQERISSNRKVFERETELMQILFYMRVEIGLKVGPLCRGLGVVPKRRRQFGGGEVKFH